MKKRIVMGAVCLCLLLTLSACGIWNPFSARENTAEQSGQGSERTENGLLSEEPSGDPGADFSVASRTLLSYSVYANGFSMVQYDAEGYPLQMQYLNEETLLAETTVDYQYENGILRQICLQKSGEPKTVYTLCDTEEQGVLAVTGEGGARVGTYQAAWLEDGGLQSEKWCRADGTQVLAVDYADYRLPKQACAEETVQYHYTEEGILCEILGETFTLGVLCDASGYPINALFLVEQTEDSLAIQYDGRKADGGVTLCQKEKRDKDGNRTQEQIVMTYTERGMLQSVNRSAKYNGAGADKQTDTFVYDDQDRLIEKITLMTDGLNQQTGRTVWRQSYGENGLPASRTEEEYNEYDTLVAAKESAFTYDAFLRLTRQEETTYESSERVETAKLCTQWEYRDDGSLLWQEHAEYDEETDRSIVTRTEYGVNGVETCRTELLRKSWEGDVLEKNEYRFDGAGNKVALENTVYGDAGVIQKLTRYTYLANGSTASYYQATYGADQTLSHVVDEEYGYGADGSQIISKKVYEVNRAGERTGYVEELYRDGDAKQTLVGWIQWVGTDASYRKTVEYDYTYDESGRISLLREKTYDAQGELAGMREEERGYPAGKTSPDSLVLSTYDAKGALISVVAQRATYEGNNIKELVYEEYDGDRKLQRREVTTYTSGTLTRTETTLCYDGEGTYLGKYVTEYKRSNYFSSNWSQKTVSEYDAQGAYLGKTVTQYVYSSGVCTLEKITEYNAAGEQISYREVVPQA